MLSCVAEDYEYCIYVSDDDVGDDNACSDTDDIYCRCCCCAIAAATAMETVVTF